MSLMEKIKKNTKANKAFVATFDKSIFLKESDSIQTSMPVLNLALSGRLDGGLESGITTLAGPSKHFKSNLALILVKAYLDKYPESICVFMDNEFGINEIYIKNVGIDPTRVVHIPFTTVEELRNELSAQLDGLVRGDKVIFLTDSIGNVASKKEMDDAEADKSATDMGTRAKAMKSLFRVITAKAKLKDVPLVFINQTYKDTSGLIAKDTMGGGCVVKGTQIQTPKGLVNIEDIKVGDEVITQYGIKEVEYTWNPETLVKGTPECIEIEFEDGYTVTCSDTHKFIVNGEWVEAKDLKETYFVSSVSGKDLGIKSIKHVGKLPVYDISIKSDNYDEQQYVLTNGIISHNTGPMYASSAVIYLTRAQEKQGGELAGYTFTMKVEKGRKVREGSKLKFTAFFDKGVLTHSGLLDIALATGHVIKPSMGWYQKASEPTGKKYRELEVQSSPEFWEDILADKKFQDACKKLYYLESATTDLEDDIDLSDIEDGE